MTPSIHVSDFVSEQFAVHHHLEVVDVWVFGVQFNGVEPAVVGRLCLKADQQFLFAYGVEELVIDGDFKMLTHAIDGQHLLPHADVGLRNRNQLVSLGVEHAIVGVDENY